MGYGVMSTPGVVIDGKVVHAGGVPSRDKIEKWLAGRHGAGQAVASTRWMVLARDPPGRTRMAFEPVTGRSHQLRVHAAAMGWPIAGDTLYGPASPTAPRLMLHASELSLAHPVTGQQLHWVSPAPF
jgi:23S rRNA-/tRNA-specific pseudouridylate synthase